MRLEAKSWIAAVVRGLGIAMLAGLASREALAQGAGGPSTEEKGPYLTGTPLVSLTQTRDRPVFAQDRRPPARPMLSIASQAPPPPAVATPVSPPLTLVGIIRSPQRGASAVVIDNATRDTRTLAEGDRYQGWIVANVQPNRIVLRSQGHEATLTFASQSPADQAKDN